MSADTPETLAFDSLRPTEHLGPTEGGLRLGEILGLGSGRPKTTDAETIPWWKLARHDEITKSKEVKPEETRAFIFNVEGKSLFVSINSEAFERPVDELKEDEFVVTEIDEEFAQHLIIDELPVEIHDNGSVVFEYYALNNMLGGHQVAKEAETSGGTWWDPSPDPDSGRYNPTVTAMKYDPEYLAGFFRAYILEKRWQSQL